MATEQTSESPVKDIKKNTAQSKLLSVISWSLPQQLVRALIGGARKK
jgi:hypothetical protein